MVEWCDGEGDEDEEGEGEGPLCMSHTLGELDGMRWLLMWGLEGLLRVFTYF